MNANDIITWLRDKLPYAPDHAWKNVMEAIIPLLGELESRRRHGVIAVINEEENERLKERIAELEAQLAKDTNVLTNADRIRAMSDEELADFVQRMIDVGDAGEVYCPQKPECFDLVDSEGGIPEEWRRKCLLGWLRQPAEEVHGDG